MKPPPFSYHRPEGRDEVDALLQEHGSDAKILAGGQSLVPLLNLRFASPAHIVDINRLSGEAEVPAIHEGGISVGPLVRQAVAERSACVAEHVPLLAEALHYVAHPAIRNRGTVVGSIAHADPAAELPAVVSLLDGEIVARSSRGTRIMRPHDFFAGPLENALADDEWIVEVRWPSEPSGSGHAFEEFARRRGDYALCGVAAAAHRLPSGAAVTLCYFGVGPVPAAVDVGPVDEGDLAGHGLQDAVDDAVPAALEPGSDFHATASYRLWLARRLGARAARAAWQRLTEQEVA